VERKPECKTLSPRTETSYQAARADELAQHSEVPGSTRKVKDGVVQLEFAFLSGETCIDRIGGNVEGNHAGVSRGHSTATALAGRSKPDGCAATPASGLTATNPTGGVTGTEAGRKHGRAQSDLLEQILSRENMHQAWSRVKANKGAPGIDGMSIEVFPAFARQHWDRIRSALYAGNYRPAAVRRVMIPKATGGERPLGIPTVLDRLIQQAIAQIITPMFEAIFHPKSVGFRPQRRARQALAEMERAHVDGYCFVGCGARSMTNASSA